MHSRVLNELRVHKQLVVGKMWFLTFLMYLIRTVSGYPLLMNQLSPFSNRRIRGGKPVSPEADVLASWFRYHWKAHKEQVPNQLMNTVIGSLLCHN